LIRRERQRKIEGEITHLLESNFSFVALPLDSGPARGHYKEKLISTVAQCTECSSSSGWLGRNSPREKIRNAGLWQVNKLDSVPFSMAELGEFLSLIR
jgi:hypothetical protein